MTEKRIWPGISVGTIEEVMEFETWFASHGGKGRYVGDAFIISGGPRVEAGDTVGWTGESWVMVR